MIVSRFSFELQLPQTQTSQHPQLRVRVSMASHRCSKKRERARTAINTQTWELINLPEGMEAIRCKWRWTQRERHLHAAARGVSSNPDIRETSARWRMCRTDWNRSAESESRNVTERCSGLHCVYCRFENGTFLIVAVYVDHLLMFWNTLCWVNQLKKQLAGKFLMKDLELTNKVLGIRVTTRQKNNACPRALWSTVAQTFRHGRLLQKWFWNYSRGFYWKNVSGITSKQFPLSHLLEFVKKCFC